MLYYAYRACQGMGSAREMKAPGLEKHKRRVLCGGGRVARVEAYQRWYITGIESSKEGGATQPECLEQAGQACPFSARLPSSVCVS